MQDKKLINISQAVIGEQGVYSIEFHEDQHYTHVKRANGDGTASYFSVGGSGGGTTYTAGTGIDITNGVISSTVVDTDTNNFISNVSLNGTDLEFIGTGGAFNATVPLASLVSSGGTETNVIPYAGNTINTDTVSIYGLREGAEKLELIRTAASDTSFVLQGGTGVLGTNNFGILVVYVTINCSGLGGINLQYMNLLNNPTDIHGSSAITSGNYALTFSYFGTTGLQLIASTEL
jgi:hypothetical protein